MLSFRERRVGDDPVRRHLPGSPFARRQEVGDFRADAIVEDVARPHRPEIVPKDVGHVTFAAGRLVDDKVSETAAAEDMEKERSRRPGRRREEVERFRWLEPGMRDDPGA
jgi:hypothetical protein